jgi:hypothetical protein
MISSTFFASTVVKWFWGPAAAVFSAGVILEHLRRVTGQPSHGQGKMLKAMSPFSGASGFCEGVRLAGFKVVCAVELDVLFRGDEETFCANLGLAFRIAPNWPNWG